MADLFTPQQRQAPSLNPHRLNNSTNLYAVETSLLSNICEDLNMMFDANINASNPHSKSMTLRSKLSSFHRAVRATTVNV